MLSAYPYRHPDPPPVQAPPSYREHWRKYRIRWLLFIGMWLAYVPVFSVSQHILSKFVTDTTAVIGVAFWIYAITWMGLGVAASWLPCPRCRRSFCSSRLFHNPFGRRCLHCGLRRGAPCDPDWKPEAD